MDYLLLQRPMTMLTIAFAVLNAVFAVIVLKKILTSKKKEPVRDFLSHIFTLFAFAFIFYAVAEIYFFFSPFFGIPDFFWILGYLLEIAAFAFLSWQLCKTSEKTNQALVLIVLSLIVVFGVTYYGSKNYLSGLDIGADGLAEVVAAYIYPLLSSILLVCSVSVYLFFRGLGRVGKSLLFLILSVCAGYAGDILYNSYGWNFDLYGPAGFCSDIFYVIDYLLSAYAMWILFQSYDEKNKIDIQRLKKAGLIKP